MSIQDNRFEERRNRREYNRFSEAGQDILDEVTRAVQEGNYAGLAESIAERMNSAVRGAVDGFSRRPYSGGRNYQNGGRQSGQQYGRQQNAGQQYSGQQYGGYRSRPVNPAAGRTRGYGPGTQYGANFFNIKRVSGRSGKMRRVLGRLGSIFAGMFAIFFGISGGVALTVSAAVAIVLFVLCGGTVYGSWRLARIAKNGDRYARLADTFYRYGTLIGGREYFLVRDLSQMALEQPAVTLQNLIDMKKYDMIPQASFDQKYTTVLLTDHARSLYQMAMQSYEQRQAENKGGSAGSDVQKILRDGNEYIRKIHRINEEIPDDHTMSDKLYRLENVAKSIFAEVDRHPEKAGELRRIMSYYLPTTTKLLDAYLSIYRRPGGTEADRATMQEIEQAIDSVCDGFERVLAKMTEVDTIDISSDISVMEHMMEQDGMKDSDLKV